MDLSERGKEILKVVVKGYIETGEPVGSRTVAKRSKLNLSPATIRNVMADLEEMGYLFQPHTSAGRVPTEKGLRLFVDALMEPVQLSPSQQERIRRYYEEGFWDLGELMRRTCRILSTFSRYPGLVMAPPLKETIFKRIEFVKLRQQQVLAVFIASSGVVQSRVVELDEDLSQEELDQMSAYLNELLTGLPLREVRERLVQEMERERRAYDRLLARAIRLGGETLVAEDEREVFIEGQSQILDEPSFADIKRMKQLLEALERKGRLLRLLDRSMKAKGIQIFIGSECDVEGLEQCSLVTSTYGPEDHTLGILGVIGPVRMDYSRIIPLVDYTAKLLTQVLEVHWVAPQEG